MTAAAVRFLVNGSWAVAGTGLLRFGLRHNRSDRLLLKGVLKHFVERADVGDLQVSQDFGRKIRNGVRFVVGRQKDVLDSGALRAQHLFLHAADRQHDAGQGNFAGHRQTVLTGRLVSKLTSAVTIATPAEGPSFGTAPDGTWMWMSCLRKKSGSMP